MTDHPPDSGPNQPPPTPAPPFAAVCDTCGDHSDSEPGLQCGRLVGPPGHDDDHPNATPCTGTYQPNQTDPDDTPFETAAPPAPPADPTSWRELFAMMTPQMWWRLALLGALLLVATVIVVVGVVQSFTEL